MFGKMDSAKCIMFVKYLRSHKSWQTVWSKSGSERKVKELLKPGVEMDAIVNTARDDIKMLSSEDVVEGQMI